MNTLLTGVTGLLGCALLAPLAAGQAQAVISVDFENGPAGWTSSGAPPLWHVAPSGECGAITAMAACNTSPASCDYAADFPYPYTFLRLTSPVVHLPPEPTTYLLEFDYLKGLDASGDVATVWLGYTPDGIWAPLAGYVFGDLPDSGSLAHFAKLYTFSDFFFGKGVVLELELQVDPVGNQGIGWLVDNFHLSTNAFTDLGAAKGSPAPQLEGLGTLWAGSLNTLNLTDGQLQATGRFIFGLEQQGASFKGGIMVPDPQFMLSFVTDGAGAASLQFVLPAGLPLGLAIYVQAWLTDPDESFGVSASNALVGITS